MSEAALRIDQDPRKDLQPRALVFVIEDDLDVQNIVQFHLDRHGYAVRCFAKGESALEHLEHYPDIKPDLFVVDINLAGNVNGLDFTRMLRGRRGTKGTPIVMLTAKGEAEDIVTGLNIGADDYVPKPFDMNILIARVNSAVRRSKAAGGPINVDKEKLSLSGITIDPGSRQVEVEGKHVGLTYTEFGLLACMMAKPNEVLERDDLLFRVMGPGKSVTARTIDVHMRALRAKLGRKSSHVATVRGVGYKFVP